MSSYLISKFDGDIPKEYLNSIITIKNDTTRNDIINHILNQKNKENVLFLIENDLIPKSMSLNLFKFITNNNFFNMFLDLDYTKFDIHADDDYAFRWSSENGHLKIVKFLVSMGSDIHARKDYALALSSYNGHIEVVEFLVEIGVDVDTLSGDYALKAASKNGHIEVVKFLVEKDANIYAYDDAFLLSCENGHIEVVRFLVKIGVSIHIWYNKALKSSCENGHIEVVKFLVENGADIHADDDEALVLSSENGHIKVVKFLLNADLEYFSTNKNAIEIVKKYNLSEFYEKFKIDNKTVKLLKVSQTPNDILKYIKSQDTDSIKKCNEFDFSTNQYYYFFKALELCNYEILKIIFDFIKNKQELKNYIDDISFLFDEDTKNKYRKLFKNDGLEKIKDNMIKMLDDLNKLIYESMQ